ncbi:MAG: ImmA/IrrE family metallo-endopeptidase [Ruminococcus sp.]|jgi:Zn-dependent peptidase ImmA (M78 family)|nr:ImmA/IrrE family metallo-endopeptidase [Ruminococcus sp.]
MEFQRIVEKSRRLVQRYKTRDPFEIARELGIHVRFSKEFTTLKGMYVIIMGNRFIIVNGKLDEQTLKLVVAHEIGHDRLHRELAKKSAISDLSLYKKDCRPEYEANLFAAELLIDTDALLELIYDGYECEEAAKILETDVNLLSLKIAALKYQGIDLREQEYNSKFLK